MSEHDEGGGNWVWPFVLGVIVGVLLMLGVGGVLVTTQYRRAADEAARARALERLAREEAERASREAERAREMEMEARRAAEQAAAEAEARHKAEKGKPHAEKNKPANKD
jgi:hypothetical protein